MTGGTGVKTRLKAVYARWTSSFSHKPLLRALEFLLPFHAQAWKLSYEPIKSFLNEPDMSLRDEMTNAWLGSMQSQLNTVIIVSSLVSAITASCFSWPQWSEPESVALNLVKALWYSVLAISMASIAAASQQLVCIQRLEVHRHGPRITRQLLRGESEAGNSMQAPAEMSPWQGFVWQIPVMLLNGSLYLFVLGLCILVYHEGAELLKEAKNLGSPLVTAVFSICAAFAFLNFAFSSVGLYHSIGNASTT